MTFNDGLESELDEKMIRALEEEGEKLGKSKEEKKEEVKKYIVLKNIKKMNQFAHSELEEGEWMESNFEAHLTGTNYWGNMMSAEYAFMMIAAAGDMPLKYYIYMTNKKLIVYEFLKFAEIGRRYVFGYDQIKGFKYRKRKEDIKISFKVKKDKYNEFREVCNFILYGFFNRKLSFSVAVEDREQILRLMQRRIKEAKHSK